MKNIAILGSTGSIGTQTLDVVRTNLNELKVVSISGNNNLDLLEKQILEFKPNICSVMSKSNAEILKSRINSNTRIVFGLEGLKEVACYEKVDIVVTAVSGMIGLEPTIEAIKNGKDIALANKETLVSGGNLVMNLALKHNVNILPVDSEHSAIFQCLMGNKYNTINKILLTASGGPFNGKSFDYLKTVTLSDALKHPNWSMGRKITIDSSTLMNKGLEAIEAKWLFNLTPDQIQVVIHPQSIIHSAVEYFDHSIIAQLGYPDMKLPIHFALFYPNRTSNNLNSLDIFDISKLTFEKPDFKTFRCLYLAFEAMKIGNSMPIVLNRANEIAVEMFLQNKIKFLDIQEIVEKTMNKHHLIKPETLESILDVADWTDKTIKSYSF